MPSFYTRHLGISGYWSEVVLEAALADTADGCAWSQGPTVSPVSTPPFCALQAYVPCLPQGPQEACVGPVTGVVCTACKVMQRPWVNTFLLHSTNADGLPLHSGQWAPCVSQEEKRVLITADLV